MSHVLKKYYLVLFLAFTVLGIFSCQKGGEPLPYSNHSSDSKNVEILSKSRMGVDSIPIIANTKDTLVTVVGGDDNEDDDDDDDDETDGGNSVDGNVKDDGNSVDGNVKDGDGSVDGNVKDDDVNGDDAGHDVLGNVSKM